MKKTIFLCLSLTLVFSSGCSWPEKASVGADQSLKKSTISEQLPVERVILKGNQVWLDGKNVGLMQQDSQKFSELPEKLPNGASAYEVTDLKNGWLFVSGGEVSGEKSDLPKATGETYFWSKTKKQFERGHELKTARFEHSVTDLGDGMWLITGGKTLKPSEVYTKAVELFDAKRRLVTSIGALKVDRTNHSVLPLDKNRILIVGGQTYSSDSANGMETKSVELYDLKHHSSKELGDLCRGRQGATLLLLEDGKVLVVGGRSSDSMKGSSALPAEIVRVPL